MGASDRRRLEFNVLNRVSHCAAWSGAGTSSAAAVRARLEVGFPEDHRDDRVALPVCVGDDREDEAVRRREVHERREDGDAAKRVEARRTAGAGGGGG